METKVIVCEECYSANHRETPLLYPAHCLTEHTQYVCETCGRCICFERDERRGLQRWNFPFKSVEIALLYLRSAEIASLKPCGIYEIEDDNERKSYKIFADQQDLLSYLEKSKSKHCAAMASVYQQTKYQEAKPAQIRKLSQEEVNIYLIEQIKANGDVI